jgi:aspartyl-tRNA(Asn)/glutamyl-tRNA(Gln) amidotransferase subunit B
MSQKVATDGYLPTIGIECHVQLKTKSKLFAAVDNDAREAAPNTTVSEICFGLPGVLPVLNQEAVRLAVKAGGALNAKINEVSKFDRKHYFYPDLPMGYQISQFEEPIVGAGFVDVPDGEGGLFRVGITRAHLEADAGKLTHPDGADYSLVDLNRAGTPLLEIVSEPDIHSAQIAKAYARELNLLMRYADVSDANLYYGNMRFDVNISVAKVGASELGTRAEIKNLNSFKAVERCIEYEVKRQVKLLEKGEQVVQETRGWDDNKQQTFSQRSKEDAHDYRYMPDPDIPPIKLSADFIESVQKELPKLPSQIRTDLEPLGLSLSQQETLIDNPELASLMEATECEGADLKSKKRIANWLTGEVQAILQAGHGDSSELDENLRAGELSLRVNDLLRLSAMVEEGLLSSTAAKEVLTALMNGEANPDNIAGRLNLIQINDVGALNSAIAEVLASNPKAVADARAGELKVLGFLVGQVMKLTEGKANPATVSSRLKEELEV